MHFNSKEKCKYLVLNNCFHRKENKCCLHNEELNASKNYEKYFISESNENFFTYKIIKFDNYYYSIKQIFLLIILSKIINLLNEKFIFWLALNILLFYGPIEKKCPYFLFKTRMYINQIFEGIFEIIKILIPKYKNPQDNE